MYKDHFGLNNSVTGAKSRNRSSLYFEMSVGELIFLKLLLKHYNASYKQK